MLEPMLTQINSIENDKTLIFKLENESNSFKIFNKEHYLLKFNYSLNSYNSYFNSEFEKKYPQYDINKEFILFLNTEKNEVGNNLIWKFYSLDMALYRSFLSEISNHLPKLAVCVNGKIKSPT